MNKPWIKQIAILFTLVYLFLTGMIMVRTEGHALSHEEHSNHVKQHSSLICSWMCVASTYVHSPEQTLDWRSNPSPDLLIVVQEAPPRPQPFFTDTIRPPPLHLL